MGPSHLYNTHVHSKATRYKSYALSNVPYIPSHSAGGAVAAVLNDRSLCSFSLHGSFPQHPAFLAPEPDLYVRTACRCISGSSIFFRPVLSNCI